MNSEVRNSKLSRRDFIKAAAAGAVATGSAGLVACNTLEGSGNAKAAGGSTPAYNWDYEADFVVCGGGTGQGSAVVAAVKGMNVILLEKREAVGGAMALSGGVAWLPNTTHSIPNGDSREMAIEYLQNIALEIPNEGLIEAFVDNAQNTLDLLKEGGVELQAYYPIEYHSDIEGALNSGGRSNVVAGPDGKLTTHGGGGFLNNALQAACENLGVQVLTGTGAYKLVTRRADSDSVPEVLGVIAKQGDKDIYVKANKGVLLATGGFEWDEVLTANYLRVPTHFNVSYNTNTGDGLRMAQSVGADLRLMKEQFGQAVYTKHGEYAKEMGIPCALLLHMERSMPGSIMVDQNGRRFCNEAADYDSHSNTFGIYNDFFENGYACDPAWLIVDDASYQAYKPGRGGDSTGFPVPEIPENEMFTVADTLEDLAEKIGINGEYLVRTVEEFNFFAAQGKDPLFHRGESFKPLTQVAGGETLAPLGAGPYHAASATNGTLGTTGGPKLNEHAQVIHVYGDVVKGLYAAGNCAGVGAPGPAYGGAGGTVGPAFVFGTIAAIHASEQEAWV